MVEPTSHTVTVRGAQGHALVAGPTDGADAPPVVLLHGGAWGECARTAWTRNIAVLARSRRVVAPDWLGFGDADKLVDFADRTGRMLSHLAGVLDTLDVGEADVVGLSMGGGHLLRDLTADRPLLRVRRAVLVSAGGSPIAPAARAKLMDFDGTRESMRAQLALAFADPRYADDAAMVDERLAAALAPGAYEAFASLTLRVPGSAPSPEPIRYDRVRIPVLVTTGAADPLKPIQDARMVAAALPAAALRVYAGCGHCPQIEAADRWNADVEAFLGAADPFAAFPDVRKETAV